MGFVETWWRQNQVPPGSPSLEDPSVPLVSTLAADSVLDLTGVVTHPLRSNTPYTDAAATIAALQELKVRSIRTGTFNPGNTSIASHLNDLANVGVKTLAILGNPLDYSTATINAYSTALTNNFGGPSGGVILGIENGGNEWNINMGGGGYGDATHSPYWKDDDRAYMAAIWAKFHPQGYRIYGGSLGAMKSYSTLGNIDAWCDAGNTHEYPGGFPPSSKIMTAVNNVKTSNTPAKSTYVGTETGYHNGLNSTATHYPTPENVAGTYGDRTIWEHAYTGIFEHFYFYDLVDDAPGTGTLAQYTAKSNHEQNFGLCRMDWSRKPIFNAVRNALTLMEDPGAVFTLRGIRIKFAGGDSSFKYLLYEKRDGSHRVVMWRDVKIWNPALAGGTTATVSPATLSITVTLGRTRTVTQYIPSVNSTPSVAASAQKSFTVTLGAGAVVLKIDP